jgi:hypothetical protein
MSRRPSKCPVCVGDASVASEINQLISSGARLKKINAAYPDLCSYSALSRHRNRCLAPEPTEALSTIEECRLWLSRADSTFQAATAIGDYRGASQSISVASRTLTRLVAMEDREQEAKEASAAESDPNKAVTIADLDKAVHDYSAKLDAKNEGIEEKMQSLWFEQPEAFGKLILEIWKDRSLLERLTANAHSYN